jgi:energy-coupling factor transport system permease protein
VTLQKSLFRAYVPPDAFVRRIHPLTKMAIVLALNLVTLWATDLYSTLLFLLICLALVIVSRSPLSAIKGFLFTVIGLMQLLTISYIFITVQPGEVTYFERRLALLSTSGGEWAWHILISDRTLRQALALDLRLLVLFLATAFFMVSTNDRDIIYGLRKLRLPFAAALIVTLIFRAISFAMDDFFAVRDAMRSKGADFEHGPLWQRVRSYVYLIIPLFILAVRRSEEVALALESRGIPIRRAGRSVYRALPFQAHDWALLGGVAALLAITLLLPPLAGVSVGYPLAWLIQRLTGG